MLTITKRTVSRHMTLSYVSFSHKWHKSSIAVIDDFSLDGRHEREKLIIIMLDASAKYEYICNVRRSVNIVR